MQKRLFILTFFITLSFLQNAQAASETSALVEDASITKSSIIGERVLLRPGVEDDLPHVLDLYCKDNRIMHYYMDGTLRSFERIEKIFNDGWLPKWSEGNPFAPRIVTAAKDFEITKGEKAGTRIVAGEKIGLMGFTPYEIPNTVMIFYLSKPEFWRDSIAAEAGLLLFTKFIPAVQKAYKIPRSSKPLADGTIETSEEFIGNIFAMARTDNDASNALLRKIFGSSNGIVEEYGSARYTYFDSIENILRRISSIIEK